MKEFVHMTLCVCCQITLYAYYAFFLEHSPLSLPLPPPPLFPSLSLSCPLFPFLSPSLPHSICLSVPPSPFLSPLLPLAVPMVEFVPYVYPPNPSPVIPAPQVMDLDSAAKKVSEISIYVCTVLYMHVCRLYRFTFVSGGQNLVCLTHNFYRPRGVKKSTILRTEWW